MLDKTQLKIIQATMDLVMERGYSSTTTKDIASRANINECTIFRKFKNKKEIILLAMELEDWNPKLSKDLFIGSGNIEKDLMSFASIYSQKVTDKMVKVSIGLRTPELYEETREGILQVPMTFKEVLIEYFQKMKDQLNTNDFESLAMMFLSMNFGFVFLKASFQNQLTHLEIEDYIQKSVQVFVQGILK
ncbi:TetR/AcrR family transcriptional regulator [Floccifex sp.]|uniref:TetR/AcrR family transcriptional regulator n=1 Tax=Floccifex sp. TaxID=2815810 RepID=UPI003F070F45